MATYPNVDQAALDAMALHDVLVYPANNGGDVWYQGVITRVPTGWLYGHDFVPETVCCTGADSFFFYDQTGSSAPVGPTNPTTVPTTVADGALLVEQWDDLTRYWTYDASGPTWTVVYDAVSTGLSSVTSDGTLDGDGTGGSPLSVNTESIQDIVGGMVSGNTETGITVTYDDPGGKLDFVLDTSGDWTGTFDGQEGTYYLDYNNFTNTPTIPTIDDTAYGPAWNGNITDGASKNAIYDEIESVKASILSNVVEDTTPQLGGELDAQGNNIIDLGNVTFQTGASGGTLRTGTSAADKFELQAYDTDGLFYQKVLEVDAGTDPSLELFSESLKIWSTADETKQITFDQTSASTASTLNLRSIVSADRIITFPDKTGTIALLGDVIIWTEVTGASTGMSGNKGYITNYTSGTASLSLPGSSNVGDIIEIVGKGGTGWQVTQAAGQTIHMDTQSTTTGAGGSISSSNPGDTVKLVCITANTDWRVSDALSSCINVV